MFQDINIEQLLELQNKGGVTFIDVRSPSEFADSTIPGSLNIPLFDDAERAEIGTIYKQESNQSAKDRGLEIISAKLPAFVKAFGQIESRKVVYCWRGGMRSKTTATILSLMDIHVYRVMGGIRAYRKWVVDTLDTYDLRSKVYVINGNTGSGKTALLLRLKELRYPVLDLEGMAAHRGSIFGHIGLRTHNQKTFESLLLQDLLKFNHSPYLLMEAESKRIGKAVIPEFLYQAKENGIQLFINLPMEERVKHILEDYRPQEQKEACIKAFQLIKKRIHTPVAAEIEKHLYGDRFSEAVYLLLEHHYDPRYKNAIENFTGERITFDCKNLDEATSLIIDQIDELSFPSASMSK